MGRPSSYTPELDAAICERLSYGETLRVICEPDDMPSEQMVRRWAVEDVGPGFSAHYARARDIGLDCKVDSLLTVAADKTRDPQCRRVEVDAMKWYLSKLAPKKYGDRLELAGDKENPLVVQQLSAAETIRRKRQERLSQGKSEE